MAALYVVAVVFNDRYAHAYSLPIYTCYRLEGDLVMVQYICKTGTKAKALYRIDHEIHKPCLYCLSQEYSIKRGRVSYSTRMPATAVAQDFAS